MPKEYPDVTKNKQDTFDLERNVHQEEEEGVSYHTVGQYQFIAQK
jgi:hypothetical protein